MSSLHRRTSHRGFTLIELLVVVSIIALLIAILLPSLRTARDQAKKVKCMANLRAIGLGLVTYADSNCQELPDYLGMGAYTFRIAPGRQLDPGDPPEAWGVQGMLETGTSPQVMPNGMARYRKVSKPLYLAAESPVWICPANPGLPTRQHEWKNYGNTYLYRQNSSAVKSPTNKDPNPLAYNLDWLNRKHTAAVKNPLVWDNYFKYPGETAFMGPFEGDGYSVPTDQRVPPHRMIGGEKKRSAKYWIGYYAAGHCQINMKNQDD